MRVRPKLRQLLQCVTILLLLLCLCYVLQNFYRSDTNSQPALSAEEFVDIFYETYGDYRVLDSLVLEDGGHVQIVDKVALRSSSSAKLKAVRYAAVKAGFHSYAILASPKQLTRKDLDTSQWKIDRTVLARNYYYYMMIEALALNDHIKFTNKCKAQILSIGLGGSTIDGFLHQVSPQMNITVVEISRQVVNMARKWFGLVEDDHHRVVVSDGVTFIAEAVRKGEIFDAILLDACASDQLEGILCPLESFLNGGVLRNIAYVLHKQGIFVVNVLSEDMGVREVYQLLTKKLKAFFAYCNRVYRPFSKNQTFVICSCYALQRDLNESSSIATLSLEKFGELLVKTYGYERQLDVFTLEDGSHVYIADKVLLPPQNSSLVNMKIMRLAKVKNGLASYVGLDLPQQLTGKAIDTSQWRLNRMTHQIYGYHYLMIEALFLSDLIEFSEKCKSNILSVGLGGGTINGFLHNLFPHMNITVVEISQQMVKMAKKWFGLVEDNYQRVVIADGVAFIAEEAKKGTIYEAVLLDACSSDQMEGIVCPLDTFFNEDVLRKIAAMLPKQGLFIVNAHVERMEIDKAYEILVNKFKGFFAYCDRLHNNILKGNNVIYCSHQTPARKPPIDIPQLLKRLLLEKIIFKWRKFVP